MEHPKPARRGRPRLSAEDARNHRVVTFLNAGEYAELNRRAEAAGHSLSAACRAILSEQLAPAGAPGRGSA